MIYKNDIPILEFDDNPIAIIHHDFQEIKLPKKCVFAFLSNTVDDYAHQHQAQVIFEFETITRITPIYVLDDLCLVSAPLGSSASAQLLDFLYGHGVEIVISTGTCGSLVDLAENVFLLPQVALRDEGASFHYVLPSRTLTMNQTMVEIIQDYFAKNDLNLTSIMTWTTDGFYRETKDMVNYRIAEGCQVVEMECSALMAVAQFRQKLFGQFLFTADTLADIENYDTRDWGSDSFVIAMQICVDILKGVQ